MSRSNAWLVAALGVVVLASPVLAQTCAPVHYVSDGIGDGCSLPFGGVVAATLLFKSNFTPSCDQHDRCYSTLGTNADNCDNEFFSNLRSACRDHYDPFWLAPLYAACITAASEYFVAVRYYAWQNHPYPGIQRDILDLSRQMQARVENGVCGTNPELTNLYTQDLIDSINANWVAYAGRPPTVFEFFSVINAGPGSLYVDNLPQWQSQLVASAQAAASVHPPELVLTYPRSSTAQYVQLQTPAPSVEASLRIGWWGSDFGLVYVEPLHFPLWNATWYIEGFAKARDLTTGVRNLKMFKLRVMEKGSCGPYYGKPVYDPENPICLE